MSESTNRVQLPLDRLEQELIQCARPGFYGELRVEVCLLPTLAFEVELKIERKIIQQKEITKESAGVIATNGRVQKVRERLSELESRFVVACPITKLRFLFKDGDLVSIEFIDTRLVPIANPSTAAAR